MVEEAKEQVKKKTEKKDEKRNNPDTLAGKLSEAMNDIKAIAKDGTNDSQNYSFQSEAAIKAAVKAALVKHSLIIIPESTSILNRDVQEINKSYKGKNYKQILTTYDIQETFTITDGKETLTGQMVGSGSDYGDKALAKATTMALKNFEKHLFNISDKEDDPDGETIDTKSEVGNSTNRRSTTYKAPAKKKTTKQDLLNYSIVFNGTQTNLGTLLKHYNAGNKAAIDFANSLTGESKFAFESLKQMK